MLTKEPGYDEFLAEKIRKGKEDIKAGRVLSKAEFQYQMKALLARLEQEQREQEQASQRETIYG
ncbi:MAG: hypothetical protein Q4A60_04255 [Pasteurellaceae bacterium]|nr:hypothetical protein [Pasteurellaceae bacterium]